MTGKSDTITFSDVAASTKNGVRQFESKDLFRTGKRVEITHGDQIYLLQITRQGKLILTK